MQTDAGGLATRAEIKVSCGYASTWGTKLSQIARSKGEVILCTYSLPKLEYLYKILDKRSDITIICHSSFTNKAIVLKRKYPALKVVLKDDVHAKIALIGPNTTILSSANFGSSGWFEHGAIIKSEDVYNFYRTELEVLINDEN